MLNCIWKEILIFLAVFHLHFIIALSIFDELFWLVPCYTAAMEEESSATGDQEKIFHELLETFTPEMAHTAYIPFCKLAGG